MLFIKSFAMLAAGTGLGQAIDSSLELTLNNGDPVLMTATDLEEMLNGSPGTVWWKTLPGSVRARTVPDNRCNADSAVLTGQYNWGNSYSSFTDSTGSYNGCGYARGALHLLTSMPCNDGSGHGWYNVQVEGLFLHTGPFQCRMSAYVHTTHLMNQQAHCAYGGVDFVARSYCADAEKKVALVVDARRVPGYNYYHAGEVGVSPACKGSGYCKNSHTTLTIDDALFSPLEEETFANDVDLRNAVAPKPLLYNYVGSQSLGRNAVLQVVTRNFKMTGHSCYSSIDSGTASTQGIHAYNTGFSGTPQCIVDMYQTAIKPKYKNTQILVCFSLWLAGERSGPSGAEAAVGFARSSSAAPALDGTGYTDLTAGLYVHRANFGGAEGAVNDRMVAQTSTVEFPHSHATANTDDYLVYTLLTRSQYGETSANGGYVFGETAARADVSYTVTLMEIAP